ncbi:cytochrome P450 [Sparassis latifolia]
MSNTLILYGAISAALIAFAVYRFTTHRSLKYIRGPPSSSFIFGNSVISSHQQEVGDLEFQYVKEYGTVWRQAGCWGRDSLVVADPKAIQHITYKAGYNYPKSLISRYISRQVAGDGQDHPRHRKIMNPAFTAGQLRTFMPLFRRLSTKFTQKWKDVLRSATTETEQVLNVHAWLARLTLDIIGEAAFDYQCGALDDEESEVMDAYKNMFADSLLYPTKPTILFRSIWKYIPEHLLRLINYIPTREYSRFRRSLTTINWFAKQVIDEKTEACLAGKAENKKDIMSILVKANASEDSRTRLKESEMTAQMATFLLAGHETTSSALTWLLWELAKNMDYQRKMRDEITAVRARMTARGDSDFSIVDLDSMTYVLAAMKETLRYHPIVYSLVREAARDDVIPLSMSITKGQEVAFSIAVYNRLPEVWGADADKWNPDRFLEIDQSKQTTVGVWSNLMSFSAGVRGCIGWRFSILEMQTILVELLENFKFSIPSYKPDIQRIPSGLMAPMVRDKMHLGTQMPLRVVVLHPEDE